MDDTELIARLRAGAASETESAAMTSSSADRIEELLAERVELVGRVGQLNREAKAVVNPSEGRVPVSWNECADWLDAYGREFVHHRHGKLWLETNLTGSEFRNPKAMESFALNEYRLLPPPNLSPAPECMDGGGWLGQGKDVPDGWEWRPFADGGWDSVDEEPIHPGTQLVQCRPPAPKREPEWVPLTKLVGRTIEGCDEAAFRTDSPQPPPGAPNWRWRPAGDALWRPFPAGTLDLDTGRVKVEPEEQQ